MFYRKYRNIKLYTMSRNILLFQELNLTVFTEISDRLWNQRNGYPRLKVL